MSGPNKRIALPQMSLHEALSLGPDDVLSESQEKYSKARASKRRISSVFVAASEFLKFTAHGRSTSLQKQPDDSLPRSYAPPRPRRPPPEQCPPDQPFFTLSRAQVFPNAPPLISQPFNFAHHRGASPWSTHCLSTNSPGSVPRHRTRNSADPHHELAYNRLTGCLNDIEEEGAALVNESDNTASANSLHKSLKMRAEQATRLKALSGDTNFLDMRESYSSLPSTRSKLVLKPSPLRLVKDEQEGPLPAIPARSKLRDTAPGVKGASLISERTSINLAAPYEHRSSYATTSVYSVDSNGLPAKPLDTPPSSPPEILQSRLNHSSIVIEDPNVCAENMRSELGIIDDIYDMYTDSDKHVKHEAEVDLNVGRTVCPQALARVKSEKLSRAQVRLRKERARRIAIEKLEAPKINVEVPRIESEQWLDDAFYMEEYKTHFTQSSVSRSSAPTVSDHELATRNDHIYTNPVVDDERLSTVSGSSTKTVGELTSSPRFITEAAEVEESDSGNLDTSLLQPSQMNNDGDCTRESLAALQNQLNALMEDYSTHQTMTEAASHRDGSTCHTSSACTNESIQSPTNLQKIGIEWQGKKYPVLIGDHGRIWEGPCFDPHCKEHGGPRKELAFGHF